MAEFFRPIGVLPKMCVLVFVSSLTISCFMVPFTRRSFYHLLTLGCRGVSMK